MIVNPRIVGRLGLRAGTLRTALTGLCATVALGCLPATAQAYYGCGTVRWDYDVGDRYSYYALFEGLDFHGGISVQGMRCSDARSFVRRYARNGFQHSSFRTDFEPPGYLTRFRCHRARVGDDVGRDYCVRGKMQVFFSDYIGGFANL